MTNWNGFQQTRQQDWCWPTGKPKSVVATWDKAELENRIMLVLVIDENGPLRSALERQVRQLGVLAMSAGSLQEALQFMRATAVDVVLMACKLPQTEPLEAWQALNDVAGNEPQFVGITSDPHAEELASVQAAGLKLFLPPNPNQEQLRQILSEPTPVSGGDPLQTPLMDPARLEDLLEISRISGNDSLRAIVTTFVESSEQRLTQLQQALEQEDQATMRHIRHGWAGIAGSLGASRLAQTLKTLNPVEMLQSPEYSKEVLSQLRLEFDDTRLFFDAFTLGLNGP